jgi:hypothetical protein
VRLANVLQLSGAGHGYAEAFYNLRGVTPGTHALIALYSGDARNPAGASAPAAFEVLPEPVSLAVSCQNPTLAQGASYRCEVYTQPVAAGSSSWVATYAYDNAAARQVPLVNGAGAFAIPSPSGGAHTVVISFAAQGYFAAANPVTEHFTVVPAR